MADTNTTQDLLQQGLTAARVGDVEDARRLLTRATQEHPNSVAAWLGLAGVVDSLEYKQRCFTKALELEPDNAQAQAGLRLVEEKLAAKQQPPQIVHTSSAEEPVISTGLDFCHYHPDVETGLRCNKCGKPICPKCAVRTPVGFRCPECIRDLEEKFYTGGNMDYLIAAVIAFPLSLIGAGLFTTILSGFGFFTLIIGFFVAPFVAGLIAEAVRWGVGKRRSRYLRHVVVAALLIATAPFLLLGLGSGLFGLILPGMFAFLGAGTISARLR